MSDLEEIFALHVRASRLPVPEREYRFHPARRWRLDFSWPIHKVAVEIDGGTWGKKGRHTQGAGFKADCEKLNEAAILGWMVIRGDSKMVKDGSLLSFVERALGAKSTKGKS